MAPKRQEASLHCTCPKRCTECGVYGERHYEPFIFGGPFNRLMIKKSSITDLLKRYTNVRSRATWDLYQTWDRHVELTVS